MNPLFGAIAGCLRSAPASPAAYWDASVKHADISLSGAGNSVATSSTSGWKSVRGAAAMTSGKRYFEMTSPLSAKATMLGVCDATPNINGYGGSDAHGWTIYNQNGRAYHLSANITGVPVSVSGADVLMIGFDTTSGKLWFGRNGTWVGDPVAGTGAMYTGVPAPLYACGSFNTAGAELDLRVKASEFAYPPPTGFTSLSGL